MSPPPSRLLAAPAFSCSAQSLAITLMCPSSHPSHHACQPPDVLPTPDPTATAALLPGFLPLPPRLSARFSVSESGGPAKTQVRPGHVAALSHRSRQGCHRGLRGLPSPSPGSLTGFLAVPPAPPTCPHPRASHSSPPHLPDVPAQEGPPDHPTPVPAGFFVIAPVTSSRTVLFTR